MEGQSEPATRKEGRGKPTVEERYGADRVAKAVEGHSRRMTLRQTVVYSGLLYGKVRRVWIEKKLKPHYRQPRNQLESKILREIRGDHRLRMRELRAAFRAEAKRQEARTPLSPSQIGELRSLLGAVYRPPMQGRVAVHR